jgi:hypothetical protein
LYYFCRYLVYNNKHFICSEFNAALDNVSVQISEITPLNETNFSTWKEQNENYLGVLEIDQALRVDKPAALTNESSADDKTNFAKWERSNRMSLMIMKNTITSAIRGGILEKDAESNYFTAKEYLISVEEQFKSTSKSNISALIIKILT